MENPLVTICIPTWQSEAFIDKTLGYARNQTHSHLRIQISIDQSDDRTEEICLRHAQEDRRVTVVAHRSRLGWARNINVLLASVTSEYFFIYPHDDILDPRYVETLLARLLERPDAASVQCDVLHVQPDGRQGLNPGSAHEGPVSRRIIASLVDPALGEPLRSLIRSASARSVRFPITSLRGFEAHQPFQSRLFAAGPALHVPEVLYWRWSSRKGGMVDSWRTVPIDAMVADLRTNAADTLDLIDRSETSAAERTVMRFALYLNQITRLRDLEAAQPPARLVDPRDVSPTFAFAGVPAALRDMAPEIQNWVVTGYVNLVRKEALQHLRSGDVRRARATLRTISIHHAWTGMPPLARRHGARVARRLVPRQLPPELRERLAR